MVTSVSNEKPFSCRSCHGQRGTSWSDGIFWSIWIIY